jgi:hypothetical protein
LSERWGSDFKVTSYDYDAPLNEYGFETKKYHHLASLHRVLNDNAEMLLANSPKKISFGWYQVPVFCLTFKGSVYLWGFGRIKCNCFLD